MAHEKAVHRPLSLHSPRLKGVDVSALQSNINERFEHLKIEREIEVDGVLGGETFDAAEEVANCLGVCGEAQQKLKKGTISEGTQKLIRGRERTDEETAAGHRRQDYREKLRKRYAKSPGEQAIVKSNGLVGVHEEPSGSNWGKKVGEMITFTGYSGPVFWCGCCAAWIVIRLGGGRIPNRIRLGYAPFISADALAHTNGLRAVPVGKCQAGDLGLSLERRARRHRPRPSSQRHGPHARGQHLERRRQPVQRRRGRGQGTAGLRLRPRNRRPPRLGLKGSHAQGLQADPGLLDRRKGRAQRGRHLGRRPPDPEHRLRGRDAFARARPAARGQRARVVTFALGAAAGALLTPSSSSTSRRPSGSFGINSTPERSTMNRKVKLPAIVGAIATTALAVLAGLGTVPELARESHRGVDCVDDHGGLVRLRVAVSAPFRSCLPAPRPRGGGPLSFLGSGFVAALAGVGGRLSQHLLLLFVVGGEDEIEPLHEEHDPVVPGDIAQMHRDQAVRLFVHLRISDSSIGRPVSSSCGSSGCSR